MKVIIAFYGSTISRITTFSSPSGKRTRFLLADRTINTVRSKTELNPVYPSGHSSKGAMFWFRQLFRQTGRPVVRSGQTDGLRFFMKKRREKRVFRLILSGFRGIVHTEIFDERNHDGPMTGKTSTEMSSVLPLDARSARIAAEGGLITSLQKSSVTGNNAPEGYDSPGIEPDGLDFIAPNAAESCKASSLSVPGRSTFPILNNNPT